jgi:glycerol-3-phosphate acyltransferase PlsY
MSLFLTLFIILLAYFVGAIPTGYLIARLRGINDIRNHGSGSSGATNVARHLGFKYFVLVFSLDCLKAYGFVRILSGHTQETSLLIIAAITLILGNAFPVFLKFKGGKGVSTSVGVVMALNPWLIAYIAVAFFCTLAITRTVGMASVAGFITLPICSAFIAQDPMWLTVLCVAITCIGLFLHRTNIKNYFSL